MNTSARLVESAPVLIFEGLDRDRAKQIEQRLTAAGARVEVL